MKRLALAIFALGFVSAAHAQEGVCTAPVAPALHTPGTLPPAPVPPKCMNLETKKSTCTVKVADAYNDQLADHAEAKSAIVNGFNAYISSLNDYTRAVSAYGQCEQKRTRALLPDSAVNADATTTPFSVKIGE